MVLYTLTGMFFGGVCSIVVGRIIRISDAHSSFVPSNLELFIFFGIVLGGAAGFGYGVARFSNGTYLPSFIKKFTDKNKRIVANKKNADEH